MIVGLKCVIFICSLFLFFLGVFVFFEDEFFVLDDFDVLIYNIEFDVVVIFVFVVVLEEVLEE